MAKLIPLNEQEKIFDKRGLGTRRFNRFINQVTTQVNDSTEAVQDAVDIDTLSLIAAINERLGSEQFLTSDSDSFTVDSDTLFVDQIEA